MLPTWKKVVCAKFAHTTQHDAIEGKRYTFKQQQRGLLPSVGYERLTNANLVPHPLA